MGVPTLLQVLRLLGSGFFRDSVNNLNRLAIAKSEGPLFTIGKRLLICTFKGSNGRCL